VSNLAVVLTTSDWWVWQLTGGKAIQTGAFEAFAAQNIRLVSLPPAPAEWMDDRVLFTARAGFSSVSLWQVSISAKNWRITEPPRRLTSGSGQDIRPSIAKNGLVVFSSLVENSDIWSLPIDASQGQVTATWSNSPVTWLPTTARLSLRTARSWPSFPGVRGTWTSG
jgi:hypothetical protein